MLETGTVLLALLIDAAVGDPPQLYRRVPHPVAWFGGWVGRGERLLNRGPASLRRWNGALLTAVAAALALFAGWLLDLALGILPFSGLFVAATASVLLAGRGLYDRVGAVAAGLRRGLDEARAEVTHLVGRDPQSLDRAGVARAAVESAAENFSDGVVAPVFWLLLLGLPGICLYKAINTLDSMLGHRSPRYEMFGKTAAWLDDLANWLPARISGGLLCAAAWLSPGADGRRAWQVMRRDAPGHRSPNAGWPEGAVAGALGFALAGPRRYQDRVVEDNWVGGEQGRATLDAADVLRARALCRNAWLLLVGLLTLVWLV